MGLIDTHAHLDDERFAGDLPEVLERARRVGIERIVAVGITAESSRRCVALAQEHDLLIATVGIHPNEITAAAPGDWDRVCVLAEQPEVSGIGETGLDRHWDRTPFDIQEEWFVRHLELGREYDLPVVIHCREADADVVRVLREFHRKNGPIRAVMHSFCGTLETAEACMAMGLTISFAGMLTYKNAADLRAVAGRIPIDRVMVETDCPYLAPVPVRGKRNEPAHVVHTAACLAEVLGVSPEGLARQTTKNARALFGLSD